MPKLAPRSPNSVPIVIDGPVAAAQRCWQVLPPQDALVIIAKAAFTIGGQPTAVAEPPVPSEEDYAPFKPKADVLMVGHAYPQKGNATVTNVQLALGSLRATLAAIGPRKWDAGVPSAPGSFDKIPLVWERAFGGEGDDRNPVGVGLHDGELPNLERVGALIKSKGDRPAPRCFAPIPQVWPVRWQKLGTYDRSWKKERWPYFPRDFDWSHFNVAPDDLQIDYPRGDEVFDLAGVHPEEPVISGRLAGLGARAFALTSENRAFREIPMNLDTVFFDADELVVSLVWRGLINVSADHAPELERLFVCLDDVTSPRTAEVLQDRFFSLLAPESAATDAKPAPKEPRPPRPPIVERDIALALIANEPSLEGFSFAGCDLSGADLSNKKLAGAHLQDARLDGAKLDGADLRGASLVGIRAVGVSFRGANLAGANFAEAVLAEANFDDADLSGATLADAELNGASLQRCNLTMAKLVDAKLAGARFDEADATDADFSGAALGEVSFRGATLTGARLHQVQAAASCFDDASLVGMRADEADLSGASFVRAKATGIIMESAKLTHARFDEADIQGAILSNANLSNACFDRACARKARFIRAKLSEATARRADLMEADFESADLSSADFRGANLYGAEVWKATLTGLMLEGAFVKNTKLAK